MILVLTFMLDRIGDDIVFVVLLKYRREHDVLVDLVRLQYGVHRIKRAVVVIPALEEVFTAGRRGQGDIVRRIEITTLIDQSTVRGIRLPVSILEIAGIVVIWRYRYTAFIGIPIIENNDLGIVLGKIGNEQRIITNLTPSVKINIIRILLCNI